MGIQTQLSFLPGNWGCSTGCALGWIPVAEFLGDGVVGCWLLVLATTRHLAVALATQPGPAGEEGMGGGVPITLTATSTGGDAAPRESPPCSYSAHASQHRASGPFLYHTGSCRA